MISSKKLLPVEFGFYRHPGTGIIFARHIKWSDMKRNFLVPRQPASKGETNQEMAAAKDAIAWLELTKKTRSKKYAQSYRERMPQDLDYWLLDV